MLQIANASWEGIATSTPTASVTWAGALSVNGQASVSTRGRQVPSISVDTSEFDGSTKYLNTSNSTTLSPQYPTITAFIKLDTVSGTQTVLSRETTNEHSFYLKVIDGVVTAGISVDKHLYKIHEHQDIKIVAGEWFQVGFRYDGRRLTTIVDGKTDSTSTFVFQAITPLATSSSVGLTIGKTYDESEFLDGHIAFVKVVDEPYQSGGLDILYNDGAPFCYSNLPDYVKQDVVHAWELCGNDPLKDQAGSLDLSNNGSVAQTSAGLPFDCNPLINILWEGSASLTSDSKVTIDGASSMGSSASVVAVENSTGSIQSASATWLYYNTFAILNGYRLNDADLVEWDGEATTTMSGDLVTTWLGTATFSATAEPNTLSGLVSWSGEASLQYLLAEITHGLNLSDEPSDKMILNLDRTSLIDITQRVYRTFEDTVNHALDITGDDMPEELTHLIDLQTSTSQEDSRKIKQVISLSHSINVNLIINKILTSGLDLGSTTSGTAFVDVGSFKFPEGRPITIGCPDAGTAPTLQLVGPSSSITMGIPDLGNSVRLDLKIINESSRGGDIVIGTGESITPDEIYVFNYRKLQNDKDAYQQFLLDNLGEKITVNWDGDSWTGVILSPDSSIVENRVIVLDENQNVACPYAGDPYVLEWNITVTILKE